jgi:nucleotide-binding universal stress UspA family protein
MFEKILVMTDFSAYANKFLEDAGSIPEAKEIVILNVVTKDPRAREWDTAAKVAEAEKKLERAKKLVKASGVEVRSLAIPSTGGDLSSDVSKIIEKVASDENVGLVVIGARGKSVIQDILLGSMARDILRHSDKHLLIMRYRTDGSAAGAGRGGGLNEAPKATGGLETFRPSLLSKMLVPTDFSQPAEAVVSAVASLKGVDEVVLLHVVSKGESEEEIRAYVHEATQKINDVSRELAKGNAKVTARVEVGSPVNVIRSVAEDEDVSMIAMSSVGESAMRVGRIGDITYGVASTASRPVMVIRLKVKYNFTF